MLDELDFRAEERPSYTDSIALRCPGESSFSCVHCPLLHGANLVCCWNMVHYAVVFVPVRVEMLILGDVHSGDTHGYHR